MTPPASPGPGHNGGPTLEPGYGWRRHVWTRARADLLPRLPLEIVRRRVKRAAELGLDYRTYATVHATTGRDIIAFLFSTNALGLHRGLALPQDRRESLRAIRRCGRRVVANPPHAPEAVAAALAQAALAPDAAVAAPAFGAGFGAIAARMREAAGALPADGIVLVGSTAWEREWAAAGRFGFYLAGERFFAANAAGAGIEAGVGTAGALSPRAAEG